MTILFINSSPRRKGNISQMLAIMQAEADRRGAKTVMLHTSELNVRHCTGCMTCRHTLHCTLPEDDAQRTLEQIRQADALVIGAPCYWGNIPGELKILFDRIVYGLMGETPRGIPKPLHKGKRAVLVSTCTTMWPFNLWFNQTRGVVRALNEILKWSGFKTVTTVQKADTKKHPELNDGDKRRCLKAISKLLRS